MNLNKIPKTQQIKLLSQGTYGCIIRPSMTCSGKVSSARYITKIQKTKSISNQETQVGKKIQQIKGFGAYFAPILESCEISYATVDDQEIKKCEFIKDSKQTFLSNQIQYVGKDSLADYLFSVLQSQPTTFIKEMLQTYAYLLTALTLLNGVDIIHFDLKENNIICKDHTHTPIIIDFGLSIDMTEFTEEKYQSFFFVYGVDYEPWCIDICFITYVVNTIGDGWQTIIATSDNIYKVIAEFIKVNPVIQNLTVDEANTYKQNLQKYFSQFIGKPWKQMVDDLLKCKSSWDNYALAVIYLNIMGVRKSHNTNLSIESSINQFLKMIVVAMPNERPIPKDTRQQLLKTFGSVPRIEHSKMKKILEKEAINPKIEELRKTEIAKSKRVDAIQEHKIYNKQIEML